MKRILAAAAALAACGHGGGGGSMSGTVGANGLTVKDAVAYVHQGTACSGSQIAEIKGSFHLVFTGSFGTDSVTGTFDAAVCNVPDAVWCAGHPVGG